MTAGQATAEGKARYAHNLSHCKVNPTAFKSIHADMQNANHFPEQPPPLRNDATLSFNYRTIWASHIRVGIHCWKHRKRITLPKCPMRFLGRLENLFSSTQNLFTVYLIFYHSFQKTDCCHVLLPGVFLIRCPSQTSCIVTRLRMRRIYCSDVLRINESLSSLECLRV